MRANELDLVFAPNLAGASPDHWQSRWTAKLSTARMIDLDRGVDDLESWSEALARAAAGARRPIVFIAHSVSALALAHAAPRLAGSDVRGAFLVAPPSEAALATLVSKPWPPTPRQKLPWSSVLVASRTDPFAPFADLQELAAAWGAAFVDAGEAGRIDVDSDHGPWPDGLLRLAGFLKGL